ncbi:MAG: hypothetical protein Q9207_005528 [Kuettlingeria erythrocarpa]
MKDQDLSSIVHHLQHLKVAEKTARLGAQAVAEQVHAFVMSNISTSHLTNDSIPSDTAEMRGENNLGEDTDELYTTTSSEGYADPSAAPPLTRITQHRSNMYMQPDSRLDSLTGYLETKGTHIHLKVVIQWDKVNMAFGVA